jgi:hypothetical protein
MNDDNDAANTNKIEETLHQQKHEQGKDQHGDDAPASSSTSSSLPLAEQEAPQPLSSSFTRIMRHSTTKDFYDDLKKYNLDSTQSTALLANATSFSSSSFNRSSDVNSSGIGTSDGFSGSGGGASKHRNESSSNNNSSHNLNRHTTHQYYNQYTGLNLSGVASAPENRGTILAAVSRPLHSTFATTGVFAAFQRLARLEFLVIQEYLYAQPFFQFKNCFETKPGRKKGLVIIAGIDSIISQIKTKHDVPSTYASSASPSTSSPASVSDTATATTATAAEDLLQKHSLSRVIAATIRLRLGELFELIANIHACALTGGRFRDIAILAEKAATDATDATDANGAGAADAAAGAADASAANDADAAASSSSSSCTNQVPLKTRERKAFAVMCHDSFLAAVWTNAHAKYLMAAVELLDFSEENRKGNDVNPSAAIRGSDYTGLEMTGMAIEQSCNYDIMMANDVLPPPDLYHTVCVLNAIDARQLYDMTYSQKPNCTKMALPLLQLLSRSTNAGERGWQATVASSLGSSEGCARVCVHMITCAVTGLHPCIHPARRKPWEVRIAAQARLGFLHKTNDVRAISQKGSTIVKDVMRLLLATLVTEDTAVLYALKHNQNIAASLAMPPHSIPTSTLQRSMHLFADMGNLMASSSSSTTTTTTKTTKTTTSNPVNCIDDFVSLYLELRKQAESEYKLQKTMPIARSNYLCIGISHGNGRENTSASSSLSSSASSSSSMSLSSFSRSKTRTAAANEARFATLPNIMSNWIGGRAPGTSISNFNPASVAINNFVTLAYRAQFSTFWKHAMDYGIRPSRLDQYQYDALHRSNPIFKLIQTLNTEDALRVQRIALRCPVSHIMGLNEVCLALGIEMTEETSNVSVKRLNATTTAKAKKAAKVAKNDKDDNSPSSHRNDNEDHECNDDDDNHNDDDNDDDHHKNTDEHDDEDAAKTCDYDTLSYLTIKSNSKNMQAVEMRLLSMPPNDLAKIALFSRTAMLKNQLLTYELDQRTKRRQERALYLRYKANFASDEEFSLNKLPIHAHSLLVCTDCKRITNSLSTIETICGSNCGINSSGTHGNAGSSGAGGLSGHGSMNNVKFLSNNEIGISSTMLHCNYPRPTLKCAKRSSAALRNTQIMQEDARREKVELRPIKTTTNIDDLSYASLGSMFCDNSSNKPITTATTSTTAATTSDAEDDQDNSQNSNVSKTKKKDQVTECSKVRRDVINTMTQAHIAHCCGIHDLVTIPIFGKAIKIFDSLLSVCCTCGCIARIYSFNRYDADLHCNKCDVQSLVKPELFKKYKSYYNQCKEYKRHSCRFCGKLAANTNATQSMAFKRIASPGDEGGRNLELPPPLRFVTYCASHSRLWLSDAHRAMPTNTIFAHLLSKIRPAIGAMEAASRKTLSKRVRKRSPVHTKKKTRSVKKKNK